jgi:hypothetical protein
MDGDERLRRRAALYRRLPQNADAVETARYLRWVQFDTVSLVDTAEEPQKLDNVGPAYLRGRAMHYRELAAQQTDPKRAQLFLDLATSFESHAVARERSAGSPKR